MMALDAFNNLDTWPMLGIEGFVQECQQRNITEINLTGTNTEPLLFKHHDKFVTFLRESIPDVKLGIRTNGALILKSPETWKLYDKASITFPSFDNDIYQKQMGRGVPPNLEAILELDGPSPIKINIVLGDENRQDVFDTLDRLARLGFKKVNLREPYGQPHVGNPLANYRQLGEVLGMPQYDWLGMSVVYWDVHYVHVESVNLYAQGRVSIEYPITRGHDKDGEVREQSNWDKRGRHNEQWVLGVNGSTADS